MWYRCSVLDTYNSFPKCIQCISVFTLLSFMGMIFRVLMFLIGKCLNEQELSKSHSYFHSSIKKFGVNFQWCLPVYGMFQINACSHYTRVYLLNSINNDFIDKWSVLRISRAQFQNSIWITATFSESLLHKYTAMLCCGVRLNMKVRAH